MMFEQENYSRYGEPLYATTAAEPVPPYRNLPKTNVKSRLGVRIQGNQSLNNENVSVEQDPRFIPNDCNIGTLPPHSRTLSPLRTNHSLVNSPLRACPGTPLRDEPSWTIVDEVSTPVVLEWKDSRNSHADLRTRLRTISPGLAGTSSHPPVRDLLDTGYGGDLISCLRSTSPGLARAADLPITKNVSGCAGDLRAWLRSVSSSLSSPTDHLTISGTGDLRSRLSRKISPNPPTTPVKDEPCYEDENNNGLYPNDCNRVATPPSNRRPSKITIHWAEDSTPEPREEGSCIPSSSVPSATNTPVKKRRCTSLRSRGNPSPIPTVINKKSPPLKTTTSSSTRTAKTVISGNLKKVTKACNKPLKSSKSNSTGKTAPSPVPIMMDKKSLSALPEWARMGIADYLGEDKSDLPSLPDDMLNEDNTCAIVAKDTTKKSSGAPCDLFKLSSSVEVPSSLSKPNKAEVKVDNDMQQKDDASALFCPMKLTASKAKGDFTFCQSSDGVDSPPLAAQPLAKSDPLEDKHAAESSPWLSPKHSPKPVLKEKGKADISTEVTTSSTLNKNAADEAPIHLEEKDEDKVSVPLPTPSSTLSTLSETITCDGSNRMERKRNAEDSCALGTLQGPITTADDSTPREKKGKAEIETSPLTSSECVPSDGSTPPEKRRKLDMLTPVPIPPESITEEGLISLAKETITKDSSSEEKGEAVSAPLPMLSESTIKGGLASLEKEREAELLSPQSTPSKVGTMGHSPEEESKCIVAAPTAQGTFSKVLDSIDTPSTSSEAITKDGLASLERRSKPEFSASQSTPSKPVAEEEEDKGRVPTPSTPSTNETSYDIVDSIDMPQPEKLVPDIPADLTTPPKPDTTSHGDLETPTTSSHASNFDEDSGFGSILSESASLSPDSTTPPVPDNSRSTEAGTENALKRARQSNEPDVSKPVTKKKLPSTSASTSRPVKARKKPPVFDTTASPVPSGPVTKLQFDLDQLMLSIRRMFLINHLSHSCLSLEVERNTCVDAMKGTTQAYSHFNLVQKEERQNFSSWQVRWGYVFMYLMRHAHLVFLSLKHVHLLRRPITTITHVWNLPFDCGGTYVSTFLQKCCIPGGVLRVCAIGGGPGSDLIGLALFLRANNFPVRIRAVVFDRCGHWSKSWDELHRELPPGLARYFEPVQYVPFDYLHPDLSSVHQNFVTHADLITIVKSMSPVASKMWKVRPTRLPDHRQVKVHSLYNLLSIVSSGTMVLYVDNKNGQQTKVMRETVQAVPGYMVVHYETTTEKLPRNGFSPLCEKFMKWVGYGPSFNSGNNEVVALSRRWMFEY